jgi:myo-inositol 2-dehydrogenase/D-chiro-inositol 1-dehydrogenase
MSLKRQYTGGIIIDSAIHELDLMCWLSGERPESVVSFGHADSQLFKECNDFETVMVMLKFPSGLIGCIENVRGVPYGYDQRFEVRYCTVT